jgi:hypothetical protein
MSECRRARCRRLKACKPFSSSTTRTRRSGKFLAFFDSRDALEAAEAGFDRQGDTIPEEIRGKRTSVLYYDVLIFDGEVEAAKAARVSLLEGSSESIDAGFEKTRGDTLPNRDPVSSLRSPRFCR